jgi:glycosyltransferase involved in cell wall biosynthesis
MKILLVGYGWPPKQAGGAIIYTKSLAQELVGRGHSVSYFYSGAQNLIPFAYIEKKTEEQIFLIQLINSPNFYDTHYNYPESELKNRIIENKFRKVLEDIQPDVVHFQNFPGLTPSLVKIAKDSGVSVALTLHNFIAICPTGELFDYNKMEICDFNKCMAQCYGSPTRFQRFKYKVFLNLAFDLPELIKKIIRRNMNVKSFSKSVTAQTSDPKALKKKRLDFFKLMLGEVDLILAVSKRVSQIYSDRLSMGKEKFVVNHLGTQAADFVRPHENKGTSYPIRFVFLANLDPHKGFQNLLEAFKRVDQTKAELHVYAPINDIYQNQIGEIQEKYSVVFHGAYKYSDLNSILKNCDIGVVPSICHDSAPLVVFEFFAAKLPVIASNVGGMSDFVIDKVNGLIYTHNNIDDLIDKLNYLINNPSLISKFSSNIKPMKTIGQHVTEIESHYHDIQKA